MLGLKLMAPLFFSLRLPTLLAIFWRSYFQRSSPGTVPQKEPRSFLLIRLDALGDVVMTTPLFRALKRSYPESRCTVVVQACYKPLLVTNPHIDEILTLPKIEARWIGRRANWLMAAVLLYWTRLRHRRFDIAISPRWDVDDHLATLVCLLASADKRVGYTSATSKSKEVMNAGFDAAFDVCLPAGPVCHEVQRTLAVAKSVGATPIDDWLEIHLTDRDRRKAARVLARVPPGGKLVALGIGARSPGRRWPLARYAETVSQLQAEERIQVVIVCSSAELGEALELEKALQRPALIMSGARLREVCAVLERCDLFVGNDSGCAHLAAAAGCRTVVVSRHPGDGDPDHFNSPVRFGPHFDHVRVLQPTTGLDGCREACLVALPHCIKAITVAEVVSAARQMLDTQVTVGPLSTAPSTKSARRLLEVHAVDAMRRSLEYLRGRPIQ